MKELTEEEIKLLNNLNVIVESYDCRMVNCDPNTRSINIEGPKDKEYACAVAVSEYLESNPNIKELDEDEIAKENAKDAMPAMTQLTDNVLWTIDQND